VVGLSVGLSPDTDDVVSDGHAQVLFDTSPSAEGRRMVVDKEHLESSFYVHTSSDAKRLDYQEPIVSADPPICSPRVSGVMRKGGELAPDEPQQLTVRYNCAVGGSTVITMRIPLEDESKESITWAWRKNNGPAPVVSAAMSGGENWENHEVGSLLMVRTRNKMATSVLLMALT
jgi:predicted glutamine amidotransferase